MIFRRRIWLLAGLLVSSCGALLDRSVTLMAADGTMGTGHASGSRSGPVEIEINGELYRGQWVSAADGSIGYGYTGSVGFGSSSMSTTSSGSAMLRAASGATLRCRFDYSGLSHAGFGRCDDNHGKGYDMQVAL